MFYSKNKFDNLVNLVGFIIRIFHDALSPEPQTIALSFIAYFILSSILWTGTTAGE